MRLPKAIFVALLLVACVRSIHAQQISPSTPPQPPPHPSEPPPSPAEPAFDPLHAERSIEVGTFYLKKGDYDAAIDRFEEATRLQPALAKPWALMGEAYEKKHDYGKAVESYQKYLGVFPNAADAEKMRKHIVMLKQKLSREKK